MTSLSVRRLLPVDRTSLRAGALALVVLTAAACGGGADEGPTGGFLTAVDGDVSMPEDTATPDTAASSDAAESAADELVEEASEAGQDVDAEGGEVDVGGAPFAEDIPEGFPDDIPVAAGEVLSALSFDDDDQSGYSLGIQAEGEVIEVVRDLAERFATAGYELDGLPQDLSTRDLEVYAFRFVGDAWEGNVVVADNSDGTVVTYAIASMT